MLAPTLMEFPTTVQSPVPTSRAPVTSTDEVSIVDNIGTGMAVASSSSSTRASVLILPDPLQLTCILLDYFSQILYTHTHHNITYRNSRIFVVKKFLTQKFCERN